MVLKETQQSIVFFSGIVVGIVAGAAGCVAVLGCLPVRVYFLVVTVLKIVFCCRYFLLKEYLTTGRASVFEFGTFSDAMPAEIVVAGCLTHREDLYAC